MKESEILRSILLDLNKTFTDCRFWRNETGVFRTGDGRWVSAGLTKGSSDIIGIVGGRFVAIEVKSETGRVSEEQKQFIKIVNDCGGAGVVVRSVSEARRFIFGILGRA